MIKNSLEIIKAKLAHFEEQLLGGSGIKLFSVEGMVTIAKARKKEITFVVGAMVILSMLWPTGLGLLEAGCTRILDKEVMMSQRERLVQIEVEPVTLGLMTKRITSVGRTKASESVVIKAETHARIKEILFTEGGTVDKDQIIIQFENDELKAKLKMAEVRLETAKSQFERTSKLHQQKLGSSKDFEKDKSEFNQAEAQVLQFKAELDKTIIKAPFAGQIGLIDFNVGSYVSANTELVTLVQSNPMKIDFKVPEKYAKDVGVGQVVEIKLDAFKDRVFTGVVEAVDSKVDPDSNSLAIKASVDNETGDLIPGLFSNVSLIIGERNNTPMINESSVLREGTLEYVWVVDKGKAHRKLVRTGVREKGMVEITAGLSKEEKVVSTGHVRLQGDGTRVKVVNLKEQEDMPESAKTEQNTSKKTEALAEVTSSGTDNKSKKADDKTQVVPESEKQKN